MMTTPNPTTAAAALDALERALEGVDLEARHAGTLVPAAHRARLAQIARLVSQGLDLVDEIRTTRPALAAAEHE